MNAAIIFPVIAPIELPSDNAFEFYFGVPGLNLGREIVYLDGDFLLFYSVPPGICRHSSPFVTTTASSFHILPVPLIIL
jgi:hypothetical protein